MKIIHAGGLIPPSSGLFLARCGRRLPLTMDHFDIIGGTAPPKRRRCKRCAAWITKRWGECPPLELTP